MTLRIPHFLHRLHARNGENSTMNGSQRIRLLILVLFVCEALPYHGAVCAAECNMYREFMQPNASMKTKATPVWSDKNASSLLFVVSLNVNTDGTRRSYSVDDFWGERKALNNLCNAMRDVCNGLSNDGLKNRRIVTQKAYREGWPVDQLRETRIASNIIPFKDGKPCPAADGYLVSSTALHHPTISDVCDIGNYVDALVVPTVVLPGNPSKNKPSEFAARGARVGDLAVAMVPGATRPVFAAVGDTGPATKLGEGSVALVGKLLGKANAPASYREIRGRGEFRGRGWAGPLAAVLIFPGTRDEASPYMTADRIEAAAKKHFAEWGGIARLASCSEQYVR